VKKKRARDELLPVEDRDFRGSKKPQNHLPSKRASKNRFILPGTGGTGQLTRKLNVKKSSHEKVGRKHQDAIVGSGRHWGKKKKGKTATRATCRTGTRIQESKTILTKRVNRSTKKKAAEQEKGKLRSPRQGKVRGRAEGKKAQGERR